MMGKTVRVLAAAAEQGILRPSDLIGSCDIDFDHIRAILMRNAPFWARSRIKSRLSSSIETYRLSARQRHALRDLVVSKIEDGIEAVQRDLPPASDTHSPPATLRAAEELLAKVADTSLGDREIRRSFKSIRRNLTLFHCHVKDAEAVGDELRTSWLKRGYKIAYDAEIEEIRFFDRNVNGTAVHKEVDSIPAWNVLQNAFLQSIFKKRDGRRIVQASGNPIIVNVKQKIADLVSLFQWPTTAIVTIIIILCAYFAGAYFQYGFRSKPGQMIATGASSEIRKSDRLSLQDEYIELADAAPPVRNTTLAPSYRTPITMASDASTMASDASGPARYAATSAVPAQYYGELSVTSDRPKSLAQLAIFVEVFNERRSVIKEADSSDKTQRIRVRAGPYASQSEVKRKCDRINELDSKSCSIVPGSAN